MLLVLALIGSLLVESRTVDWRRGLALKAMMIIPAVAGLGGIALFGLAPIRDRFAALNGSDLRFEGWPIVLRSAQEFLPLGSGLGSFDTVYRAAEPLSQVSGVYFNHAHNDFLELWLETGLLGLAVLLAFGVWLAIRIAKTISRSAMDAGERLPKAAAVVVVLLLAHSLVDFPLRTQALAILFAFACAMLAGTAAGAGPPTGRDPPGWSVTA